MVLFLPSYFACDAFFTGVLGQREEISLEAKQAYGIVGLGTYF